MRRRERVLAGLLGAAWMVIMVAMIQNMLEQPIRIALLGVIAALAFLLVWLWTEPRHTNLE